ncbi:hypothetical protein C5L33_001800 [Lactobacillus pasteurii]|uniref:Uncharacterized protein n=1 Tax=Lactobacillus pasteurii DSM 23907 = CRBIP 24.76 TaxID=1423790 RepID=I7LCY0_9LACO|nr:hypothetical protein C5L33_001795 [Lactobacillus pasteurii]TDG77995.1 hypothetical protein C5L33_001800 [Lactobacillus pasteurii]CCI84388.1 Protein of unknown function [Lactobacillus pasteurii DSM 23907 = CRBIP 24.76]CCI84393.1 Protein of unknown function [Lactobacillus pasteurii DSM 23907 = CRBIP 24.76]
MQRSKLISLLSKLIIGGGIVISHIALPAITALSTFSH